MTAGIISLEQNWTFFHNFTNTRWAYLCVEATGSFQKQRQVGLDLAAVGVGSVLGLALKRGDLVLESMIPPAGREKPTSGPRWLVKGSWLANQQHVVGWRHIFGSAHSASNKYILKSTSSFCLMEKPTNWVEGYITAFLCETDLWCQHIKNSKYSDKLLASWEFLQ